MNIKYDLLNEPFFIGYGDICNITIENKLEYRKIIENIYNQEKIELYDDEKLITKYKVIENSAILDFADKKITTKIIKDLMEIISDEKHYEQKINLNSSIVNFINDITLDYPYILEIGDEINFESLLKVVPIKPSIDYTDFMDKFVSFLDIYQNVLKIDVFYTINLLQYFTEEELKELSDYIKIKNICIINYDNILVDSKYISKKLLFDNDLCRVL
ncbi:type II-A CRISPR-associated protein Csn2 [Finegoldia magna]|uniref:type II-A CRISPR-associated protein Csn2 n=1 Tax=Finegoldia magna TaxID=1260 RepID=UPI002803A4AE|nr:type II-A CRISPR-associated protein Csn2 [Finegoldia magna]MDU1400189.1 type II-A CRISPR-associated protein Csn2 [Finegoldia magna]MDU1878041.1 type II-A CRISPR-associated protein Csn2 [Finegoldia magna]